MKNIKKLPLYAIMTALAMIFGYIEHIFPLQIGVPGAKLGLANIVVIVALYTMPARSAVAINVVRMILISLLFGTSVSLMYSLAGGLFSFAAMAAAKRTGRLGVVGVSALGGTAHNAAQIVTAAFIAGGAHILYYLPALLAAGVATGAVTGIAGGAVLRRLGNDAVYHRS